MQIQVTKTTKAASSKMGTSTKEYLAGETYDMFDELAEVFLKEDWGKKEVVKVIKEKVIKKSPENKAITKSPENKKLKTSSK